MASFARFWLEEKEMEGTVPSNAELETQKRIQEKDLID